MTLLLTIISESNLVTFQDHLNVLVRLRKKDAFAEMLREPLR